MKSRPIKSLYIFLIICCCPTIVYASFAEIWRGKAKHAISKVLSIDLNKNGINEILFLSGEKQLELIEWDKIGFLNKWQTPEFKKGLNFEYYDFNNLLLIEKYDSRNSPIIPYTIIYKDGKYFLEELKEPDVPFWQREKYITSGSFKKKDSKDIIVTTNVITYGMKPEGYLFLNEAKAPYKLLWTSPFKIFNYGVVSLFGDFDNDKKIELLVILYRETKGFWMNQTDKGFIVKEIKSQKKTLRYTLSDLFPLHPDNPKKYFKVGRITSKDFDEIIFIDPLLPFPYGALFKAKWMKDRFDYQEIIFHIVKRAAGYDNLNLEDIDNDGLDEIILSEIRGDLVRTEEEPYISNRRDVVEVIKWNGKEYKKIWTSKPLGAITQILIDDVTGDGKKEIVVGNEKGEIHIFGQN